MSTVVGSPPGVIASGFRLVTLPIPATGLSVWFDADDASTITYATAPAVSQWRDKSGNSRHANVSAVAPIRDGAMNGRTAVRFSNGARLDIAAFAASFTAGELFAVFQIIDLGLAQDGYSRAHFLSGWTTNPEVAWYPYQNYQLYENWGINARPLVGVLPTTVLQPHIYNVRVPGGSLTAYVNGTAVGTQTYAVGFGNTLYSLGTALGAQPPPHGLIAEIVVYNRVLSTTERNTVNAYLQAKWLGYTDALLEPFNDLAAWTISGGSVLIVAGRTGTAVQMTGTTDRVDYDIPAASQSDTITTGFAWRYSGAATALRPLVELWSDTGTVRHNQLTYTPSTHTLAFTRATTPIASTTTLTLASGTWYYIEVQTKLHDTAGAVTVRVDGVVALTATSVDTRNGGTKTVYDQVRALSAVSAGTGQFDDLYISTGAAAPFKGSITIP